MVTFVGIYMISNLIANIVMIALSLITYQIFTKQIKYKIFTLKMKVKEEKHGTCTIRLKMSNFINKFGDFFQNFSYVGTYDYANLDKHTHIHTHFQTHTFHTYIRHETWDMTKEENLQFNEDLPRSRMRLCRWGLCLEILSWGFCSGMVLSDYP